MSGGMLRRPSRMPGHDWSIFLNNNSQEYVVPPSDLAPFDPRTQDPNIAPWADIEHDEEDLQALPPITPTGKRANSKASSFSLTTGGLFGRQQGHRNSEAQEAQSISASESKKSFLGIKGLRRKNSKPSLAKEPSFAVPNQPVPPLPGSLVIPSGSIPKSPPSPPATRSKFRKPSKNKQAPPVPAKDAGDDIFLDTNFDSLDGIVDSSRLGADSRVSFTHDAPSSTTLHATLDDGASGSHANSQQSSLHHQLPMQSHRQRPRPSMAPLGFDPMASTESWDFMQAQASGSTPSNPTAKYSTAPFDVAAFTNPFAGGNNSAAAALNQKRKPQPLRLASSSPSSRPLPLLPPPSGTLAPNGAPGAVGNGTVSPTDIRGGVNDPASPSWVAPESWGVKRLSVDEETRSLSGESENLQMTEPVRNGIGMHVHDEDMDASLQGHSMPGRQLSIQAGTGMEYKIRVIQQVEATASPYMIFKVPYTETAQSFIKTKWNPRMKTDAECRLWIRDRGRDRMLAGTEKILPLLRKRLEMAGYYDDELATVAGEDLGHIFKLIVRDVTWRADIEEPAQVANPQFVDLTGMNLTKVPILLHRVAPHIVLLNLSRNIGIDLPSDFIQSCEALRELKLAGVGLRRVPPAIRHSRYLARLDISSNRIADLEDSGLDSIATLASLKLQSNRLKSLPNYFASMTNIKDLNVSNNKFDGFPIVLASMTSLLDLDVSYNNIRSFPPSIGKLVNLQRLTVIGNELASFAPECTQLVNLEVLDCRRNQITDLSLVTSLPKLKQFLAHHNAVHVLDVVIGPCLTDLKAPHNQITRLKILETPHSIALMHLDLSYTKLSSIDDDVIAQLTSLSTLRLDHNHFRTLPASLCKLTYLQHLSCSNNVLDELPTDIGNLENLSILDVHSNSLHQIPASIWQCKSLYLFNATSNLIDLWRNPPQGTGQGSSSMPSGQAAYGSFSEGAIMDGGLAITPATERRPSQATLIGMRTGRRPLPLELSLQKLYLSDNLLRDDGIYFLSRLPQLRVLNISFNDIQDLPSTWLQRLPLLEELYLSGNKLSALPVDGLQVLSKLHTLYLNGNRLQTLPSALNKIPSLTVLDVGSNMLRYNINNWHFDWNWNFNRNLKYLNLSGNARLEIVPESTKRNHPADRSEGPVLHEFTALTQLKVLGLMDVTTGFISNIPDDNEERRVRTSGSEINGMGYGIADSTGKLNSLSMFDIVVPSFRMHSNECLFGMFGRPELTHSNTRLTKFVQDRFHGELIIQLNQLRPELEEGVVQAFRRAFLSMNRELYKFLTNSSFGPFARKMSTASVASINNANVDMAALKAGLSAVVIYIVDKMMYVANVGNALAVVSKQGTAHLVSHKHDPLDRDELSRIRGTEAWVSPKELLNDEMNVSRAFGMYHLLPSIIARPAVYEWDITDQDEFVIIGNCNLWDYVPYQNAVDIARQCRDPMAAAQKLRDMAISYGADGSVMIMVLSVSDLFPAKVVQRKNALETGEFGGFKNPLRGNNEPISSKMLNRLPDEVDAPVGFVALVFTDIVNSTHLWEKNAGMRTAILMHNELLRRQLLTIGGYLVKTEGDAFMCAFPTVVSALLWCLTVQSTLLKLDWPLEILESQDGREIRDADDTLLARGLAVRMGMHWGAPLCEPDFITHRMDYFGPMVNRSARICNSAKGGQLMISNDVIKELAQHFSMDGSTPPPPPPKFSDPALAGDPDVIRERNHIETLRRMEFVVTPVGERKLKGIEAPEELSLIWSKDLAGRRALMNVNDEEGMSAAAADANSRVPFSIAQMKQLAMLCIRLETLTSDRVFKPAQARKKTILPAPGPLPTMTAVPEEDEGPIDIVPGVNGIRPTPPVVAPRSQELELATTTNPVYLIANPELLMPSIKEGATDEYLMLLLDSLSLRIDNALASLYLKQLGGYLPLTGSRAGSIVDLEGLGLFS